MDQTAKDDGKMSNGIGIDAVCIVVNHGHCCALVGRFELGLVQDKLRRDDALQVLGDAHGYVTGVLKIVEWILAIQERNDGNKLADLLQNGRVDFNRVIIHCL